MGGSYILLHHRRMSMSGVMAQLTVIANAVNIT